MSECISRHAVNEIINDIRDCISVEGYCAILERLKKLPSVNAQEIVRDCTSCRWSKDGCCAGTEECHLCMWESQYKPKTGHWINICDKDFHDYRTGNKLCFECSECRSEYTYKYNYCPNCGCRMQESEEA